MKVKSPVENKINNKLIIEFIKTLDNRIDILEKIIMTSGTPELKKEFLKMIKKEMQGVKNPLIP